MSDATRPEIIQPDAQGISRAAAILQAGGVVAVPTETVYGLAARSDRDASVAAIYKAKGRPSFNPLIVHVPDVEAACAIAVLDERAHLLAQAFWPGPLTLVLPLAKGAAIAPAVTAGLDTIAVRCPAHPVMRALIEAAGRPLAAPSANRSGGVSPTSVQHVLESLGGNVDAVIDGGPSERGVESTIVALRADETWQLLRPGPITEADLVDVLGVTGDTVTEHRIEAPGQLASHYSPGKPVRLDALTAQDGEYHVGFGPVAGDENLSASGDLIEAAANLYSALHRAAASECGSIAVAPLPADGIGLAINDRLRRAAA